MESLHGFWYFVPTPKVRGSTGDILLLVQILFESVLVSALVLVLKDMYYVPPPLGGADCFYANPITTGFVVSIGIGVAVVVTCVGHV